MKSDTPWPVLKIRHFRFRVNGVLIGECGLETFWTPDGEYAVIVTELASNLGPSVTNCHGLLRREVEKYLGIARGSSYLWFERYTEESYCPPQKGLDEVCRVALKADGSPHWHFVPEEIWAEIYEKPKTSPKHWIRRPAANERNA